MDREFHRLLPGLLLFCLVFGWTVLSGAQDEDPPAAEAPPAPAEAPRPPAPSPLVGEPQTPEELFESAVLMVDVARLDLAKQYLDKLVEQDPDDAVLTALRDRFGAAPFVRLARINELNPSAETLLERSNAATVARAQDPDRISRLLDQLEGEPEEAAEAAAELDGAGTYAVPTLIKLLREAGAPERQLRIVDVLVGMGQPVIPQLLGAMSAPDDALRSDVATVLGRLRASEAVPHLWRPAFAPDVPASLRSAARIALARILRTPESEIERLASAGLAARLVDAAGEHYRNEARWELDENGRVTLWLWSHEQGTIVPATLEPAVASEIEGLRMAKDALALAPEERRVQVLYLSLALASDIRQAGFDRPLPVGPGTAHDAALSVGADVAAEVLSQAVEAGRPATAVAALDVLARIGTLPQLSAPPGKTSPIMAALDYPDPRVQFAAAVAVLQLDPPAPLRGASRVVEVLARAAASDARPHAVIGEVSLERASEVSGFLAEMGYRPLLAMSGRDAFRTASGSTDVDLIVLHPNLIRWALTETLANLRADARTASIPIVIHGPADLRGRMHTHLRNYRLVSFAPLAQTSADFAGQTHALLSEIRTPPMTPEQRAAQRRNAVAWLAHIAQGRRMRVFDITPAEEALSQALADPELADPALEALSEIATRLAQRRIADVVLDGQASTALRETGAVRLAFHIQRFGLLLSGETVDALHRAWADASLAADVRTALGGVIGTLKPNAALVGRRLQSHAGAGTR